MTFEQKRTYRTDDRDLSGRTGMFERDNSLVVNMGGNGDWYVMIVKTGEKFGPSVRVTTSGAMHGQDMVAPAVHNLYRAIGGEQPFVLTSRDDAAPGEHDDELVEAKVIWETTRRSTGEDDKMPVRVWDNGIVEALIRPAQNIRGGWRKLTAEPIAKWAWRRILEHLLAEIDVLKGGNGSGTAPSNSKVLELQHQLLTLTTKLETARAEATAARADAERWRKDAVEDQPARETLEELRKMLGVKVGQSTTIAVQRLMHRAKELGDAITTITNTITTIPTHQP